MKKHTKKFRRVKRNIKNKVGRKSVKSKRVRRKGSKKKSVKRKMKGGAIPPCDKNNPLSINDIWTSMHTNNFEICGCAILDENTNKYHLFQNGQGPAKPPAARRYCQTRLNYGIIWHTHPACCKVPSKLYPSIEDLLKVVKHGSHTSMIFCQYGVWSINCEQKLNANNPNDKQVINEIRNVIELVVNQTLVHTNNGQDINNDSLNFLIDNIFVGLKQQGLENYIPSYKIAFNFWDHYQDVLNFEISDRYKAINPNDHFY